MRRILVPGQRSLLFFLSWVVGILAGMLVAAGADDSFLAVMRRAVECRVSIVLLLPMAFVPFLITAYAVTIHQYPVFLASCFVRSFGFGCCAWLAVRAFGSAAWLVQPVLQFSDTVLMGVYAFFGLYLCRHWQQSPKRPALVCMLLAAAVTVFDYAAVSPFLASLTGS